MRISKISPRTGDQNIMDLDITEEQLDKWQRGALIQDAMPNLSREEREFLISGYTPEDWKELFGEEEEDE